MQEIYQTIDSLACPWFFLWVFGVFFLAMVVEWVIEAWSKRRDE